MTHWQKMFYVVRFGEYRFNFNRFIFHLLVRFFHILLLLQTLMEFGFLQIYLNTKLLFHGSYQGSLVNENLLGWLPWLHIRLVFLHIQKKYFGIPFDEDSLVPNAVLFLENYLFHFYSWWIHLVYEYIVLHK